MSFDDDVLPEPSVIDLSEPHLRAGVKWRRPGAGMLAAWVADTDFLPAPPVRHALMELIDRGDLGYPEWPAPSPLAEPFVTRMATRYGWTPEPEHVRDTADIVQALQIVLHLTTEPGDAVALHTPNYPVFLQALAAMRRVPAFGPVGSAPGRTAEPDALAESVARSGARVLLLVNPHNPTGAVFTRAELDSIAELVVRRDLLVLADEIYADVVLGPAGHVPFASLGPEVAARTVTLTSASKTFNLAGLRSAVMHVGPDWLRERVDTQPHHLFGVPNVLGVAATRAAWADGDEWLAGLLRRLRRNRDIVTEVLGGALPAIRYRPGEAGYLAWLDCAGLGLPAEPAVFFRDEAGVQLSPGATFGAGFADHVRLNFGTSETVLREILERMVDACAR